MAFTDVGGTHMELTPGAWEDTMRSGAQGSIFPQALSEMFAEAGFPVLIQIDSVLKTTHFPGAAPEDRLLVTTITPRHPLEHPVEKPAFTLYTNLTDLWELRIPPRRGFHAVDTAREYVRLYRLYYGI